MTEYQGLQVDIKPYLQEILPYIESNDFAGYDPYDALNSPLLNLLSRKSKWLKIYFMQSLKWLPINLRPLLGIKKGHNPKAIGLFLWGYSRLFKLEKNPGYLDKIDYLLLSLEKLKSGGYSGNCWGYNFDWQNKVFFVPSGTPTIVNSSFIGHALLDTYQNCGKQKALDLAIPISDFIINDLKRKKEGKYFCFNYSPAGENYVHNANLLGASLLIRLSRISNDGNLREIALSSFEYTMKHQHDDGSWYYGELQSQRWIDSFHTGFNLMAIKYFLNEDFPGSYEEAFEKAVKYYAGTFFLEDGTPKYYQDRTYPIDIHACSQAICFFSGMGRQYQSLTEKVLGWMLSNMYSNKGFFYYMKGRFITNKIAYMRWSQAWGFHALTSYLYNRCLAD